MAYETRVYNPGCLVVVLVLASAFLHVKISVTLFRVYVGMVTCLEHICAGGGGGNVTFLVYTGFPLYCWCQCGILGHYRYGVMSVAMTFSCVCAGDVGGAPWNTHL